MKKCENFMSCSPTNDSRGRTLGLNLLSAVGWIQARVALPLAQTTGEGESTHFFLFLVMLNSYPGKDTLRT